MPIWGVSGFGILGLYWIWLTSWACCPPSYSTARTLTFSRGAVVSKRVEAGALNGIIWEKGEEEEEEEEEAEAILDERTGRDVMLARSEEDVRGVITERAVAVENALILIADEG